ncbi:carbamoyltransferase HypF [Stappia sp. P2PMeth1]|uniref:carbamoyltransferase HypF n=1 Tax=Stappia sp. P2PMeth1 TaxID=2003586 RepID=UPI001AD8B0DB|nr:carbamoyltransferase HypF [Stappia sp. P2PMeth1]
MVEGWIIRVRGQVQGVGFRPFVWTLARRHGLRGFVLNDPEGVLIHAAGPGIDKPDSEGPGLDAFALALRTQAPPLARVDAVECRRARFDDLPPTFEIRASAGSGAETRVTPDAATCAACAAEIVEPGRRRGYAFTNCTHCGPRYSILRSLPYDRARTAMSVFAMCPDCAAEYSDPADRRFHAQPIACPACGPRLCYEEGGRERPGDPLTLAVERLRAGGIVAVKGLGGFHLACDAGNADSLALLRRRKRRPAKPFALMAGEADLAAVADLSPAALALLRDPAAPVVLVPSRRVLPEAVAPGMTSLGVMLPYTPLHHLLLAAFGGVLVMTSGNLSGEPQVIGNDEAREKLAAFADGFLLHDRDILRRLDDGVERAEPPMVLRRARGRVPGTLPLPPGFAAGPQVLALGGQMKGAVCLVKNGQALLSQHLGDLDDALTLDEFHKAIADCTALFDHRPDRVAIDLHPDYRASQAGEAMGLPVTRVQHHHAHLAACLADNLWPSDAGPVAGIVLDGTGLGTDGTLWGGEVLLGDYGEFERICRLRPAPLAGGDRAALEPWRNLLARLDQAELAGGADDLAQRLMAGRPVEQLRAALRAGINAPLSSSAGRLFDAVAAALGLCPDAQSYEGEAAMRLEAMAASAPAYPFAVSGGEIDPAPMIRALLADLAGGTSPARIAGAFHAGLARAFCVPARDLVETGRARAVALTGGCFQNARLLEACQAELSGLPVLVHRQVPANDGGLALGQALVCLARAGAEAG